MAGESGVRRLRGEKQQKWSNRQKMLPEVVKKAVERRKKQQKWEKRQKVLPEVVKTGG